jgi:glycosyltransferase involved in cell wall biosynthesis
MPNKINEFFTSKIYFPISNKTYDLIVNNFSWWPIDLFVFKNRAKSYGEKRIAYYIWRFPVLSQTFIQREIEALRESGLSVVVVADAPQGSEILDESMKSLTIYTKYLLPMEEKLLSKYRKYFFLKNPLLYLNLFFYVVTHKYRKYKNLNRDLSTFSQAVYLAGVLKENNINHVHSPWANRNAFISLIASKLLGIPYTVQARAYDIHRKENLYILRSILENAEFIVTNTQYNESYLKGLLKIKDWGKIHIIYNGVNLQQFNPKSNERNSPKLPVILSVARLTEQKGVIFLLKACKILKGKGYSFSCEVIGAPVDASYHLKLKILHRKLGLEDCVFFLGSQSFNTVMEKYKNADFVVLPCLIAEDGSRDITPNTLIEAMAMKLPVISTDITGIPEIVDNGLNGILIPPCDENALAEAMVTLIDDYSLRKKFGENGMNKIIDKFDINKNVLKYITLFKGETDKN